MEGERGGVGVRRGRRWGSGVGSQVLGLPIVVNILLDLMNRGQGRVRKLMQKLAISLNLVQNVAECFANVAKWC